MLITAEMHHHHHHHNKIELTELQFREIQQAMAFWEMKCTFTSIALNADQLQTLK